MAAGQHALITTGQASAAGLTVHQVPHLLETGTWERRAFGVLAVAGAPRTFAQDVLAACLAAGPAAVACRGAAARLFGVGRPWFDAAPVEVLIPRNGTRHAAAGLGVAVCQTRHLDKVDRDVISGIPVTTRARLVVDLLGRVEDEALFAAADDILWEISNPGLIRQAWHRSCGGRHRRALEAVLLPWLPGPRPGSPKEMSLSRVLQAHGLPRPERQHAVAIPGRSNPRYLDLAYPLEKVAPEYDGRREHGPRRWGQDAGREDELGRVGWLRLPAGRLDLVEPGASEYSATVRAALAARGSAAAPAPTSRGATPEGGRRARAGGGGARCSPRPDPR